VTRRPCPHPGLRPGPHPGPRPGPRLARPVRVLHTSNRRFGVL